MTLLLRAAPLVLLLGLLASGRVGPIPACLVALAGAGVAPALICGFLAEGTRPAALWRLLWPSILAVLVAGWAAVALLR